MPVSESPQRPDNFNEKLEQIRSLKGTAGYYRTLGGIQELARGEDPAGIRDEYYPGWTDEDFVALLHELGEEVEEV